MLQAPATLRSHARLLAALKGLSMLGRLLPAAFERVADEVLDFVVADLLEADVSRWGWGPGATAACKIVAALGRGACSCGPSKMVAGAGHQPGASEAHAWAEWRGSVNTVLTAWSACRLPLQGQAAAAGRCSQDRAQVAAPLAHHGAQERCAAHAVPGAGP